MDFQILAHLHFPMEQVSLLVLPQFMEFLLGPILQGLHLLEHRLQVPPQQGLPIVLLGLQVVVPLEV